MAFVNPVYFSGLLADELSEDMEASSETTTGPSDTTKDSCDVGEKQIFEGRGRASSPRRSETKHSVIKV